MGTPIERAEHEEFVRRMEAENQRLKDENDRQNKRLDMLETNVNQIVVQQLAALTTTIERLNLSVSNLLKEQGELGDRLKKLEGRDGEMWRKIVGYVATAVAGAIAGYILKQIGM